MAQSPTQVGQNSPGQVDTDNAKGQTFTKTVVSGTPFQVSVAQTSVVYLEITTAAAIGITMGATSAGTGTTVATSESETLGVTTLVVPAGWYVVITGTVADFVVTAVLGI